MMRFQLKPAGDIGGPYCDELDPTNTTANKATNDAKGYQGGNRRLRDDIEGPARLNPAGTSAEV
jgi:hypothetical protein